LKQEISIWFEGLQEHICNALSATDGQKFREDLWQRDGGGGGKTRILEGNIIEKGGVNFSAVYGKTPEKILEALQLPQSDFFATGVSIVLHPHSPLVPIIHANIRYFEMSNGTWWFGGGIDLTPHYVVPEQAAWFHEQLKNVCDKHDLHFYPKFKKWADDYFYIKHRHETRGIGGIFFDHLNQKSGYDKETLFEFVKDIGLIFSEIYIPLINQNKDLSYTDEQKTWQNVRRGRYVEFNLVYDKGTKFGLETDGRIESILMSLPKTAQWFYDFRPQTGSQEEKTLHYLRKGIDWVDALAAI